MSDDQDSMLDAAGDFVSSGAEALSRTAAGVEHVAEFWVDTIQTGGDMVAAAGNELIGDTASRDEWERRACDNVDEADWDTNQASLAFSDAGEHVWGGGSPDAPPADPQYDEMMRTDQGAAATDWTPDFDPNVPATGGV